MVKDGHQWSKEYFGYDRRNLRQKIHLVVDFQACPTMRTVLWSRMVMRGRRRFLGMIGEIYAQKYIWL